MIAVMAATVRELKGCIDRLGSKSAEKPGVAMVREGRFGTKEAVVCSTGVGKALAAAATESVIRRYSPSCVIFTGIAGGIDPALSVGDLFIAGESMQWDFDARPFARAAGAIPFTPYRIFTCDSGLLETAYSDPGRYPAVTGRLLTGDTFIRELTEERRRYFLEELKGNAVDMEGAAAALIAEVHNVPFICFKVISDLADGIMPRKMGPFIRESAERLGEFTEFLAGRL